MSGAALRTVRPSNGRYHKESGDNVHKCPTQVISIENTTGGVYRAARRDEAD